MQWVDLEIPSLFYVFFYPINFVLFPPKSFEHDVVERVLLASARRPSCRFPDRRARDGADHGGLEARGRTRPVMEGRAPFLLWRRRFPVSTTRRRRPYSSHGVTARLGYRPSEQRHRVQE